MSPIGGRGSRVISGRTIELVRAILARSRAALALEIILVLLVAARLRQAGTYTGHIKVVLRVLKVTAAGHGEWLLLLSVATCRHIVATLADREPAAGPVHPLAVECGRASRSVLRAGDRTEAE
jgi:hypothetical protein